MGELRALVALSIAALACAAPPAVPRTSGNADWRTNGGDAGNSRYSYLEQINRSNVANLKVAWVYHTGDSSAHSQIQATPIVVDGVLYTTTPALNVVALRADNGALIWRFNPFANGPRATHVNRGVAFWSSGGQKRIFFTAGRRLYSIDASSGQLDPSFGDSGSVDLGQGLGRDVSDTDVLATSPGVIYQDVLIQGTRVGEDEGAAPGDIRAYDVHTGKIRWTFHTIPHPGELGYDTWPPNAWQTAGGANSWAGMSVDAGRGIVYVPTGSATPDFYGGQRHGRNLFANTLLALDARTGLRIWHFQTVHHDLWDRDLPAAPNLLTIIRDKKGIDAVAQITKSGFVYLFNRQTGEPLFPIEERPAPPSDLVGEQAWPTQPAPVKPAPFARQSMDGPDLNNLSPKAAAAVARRFSVLRHDGFFAPPSRNGTVVLPGFDGGGEWGGAAVDRITGVIYVNSSDVPWIAAMRDTADVPKSNNGNQQSRRKLSPYAFAGYERWRDSAGLPAIKPPWGTLSAIDLNTGEYRWRIALGEHPALAAKGITDTGAEQYGGPIVTAGGLVFIAATMDEKFRAFDKDTGNLLWQTALPAAGYATPATYMVNGKQFVVIAAGGGKLGTKSGDAYVAFALP
ncbi:MAG TPA: pyrroloquinoline quinone-dependent dehydrogenase [Gemmatimonadaceae bacterium]|nr:pyrroloquinoline quinone-dependent dehydrogenase [Gemmatimonadaceae bacterium]